jgi:dipeptidase D
MSTAIDGLKPGLVWKYFAEIAKIPRGSKNETAIGKYVLDTAKGLGLEARKDKWGNVVVKKPATSGRDKVATIVLQGHLDMVCEKNKEKVHNFEKDPIELVRKGNLIMANGTTLGADNGIAVATNLAIMEDRSLEHGPLELLFTVDEETGLTGASNLAPGFITGTTLLNLDSEEEGVLYVGCSGGRDTIGSWKLEMDSVPGRMIGALVKVEGLKGGHSGLEIDKGRANAIKILARVLTNLSELGARVAALEGGNKHNAIPREAEAHVFIPKNCWGEAVEAVFEVNRIIKAEFATTEPELALTIVEVKTKKGKKEKALKKGLQKRLLQTIAGLPHGVTKMSADIPGLVETSTNVAVIRTMKKSISLATSQRSSVASEIGEICDSVVSVLSLGGADVTSSDGYPGWKPNLDSRILALAKSTYLKITGKEPDVKAIHAGLECGIIGEKYPGIDMLSFGPTLEGVHSPDEKIYIDTVDRFWYYLLMILKSAS